MTFHKNKKTCKSETYKFNFVPGTGFEPAHGFPRCDLNTVRLPISPPGQNIFLFQFIQGCKYNLIPDFTNPDINSKSCLKESARSHYIF
jgi:hypothetical protein